MSRIVVAGGGIVGLSMAMMLAKQGHEVTVLERDGGGVPGSPDQAWQAWDRHGVAQFRLPHYLHAAGRQILDTALPEVTRALLDSGAATFDMLALMPPFIEDRRPGPGRPPWGARHRAGDRPGGGHGRPERDRRAHLARRRTRRRPGHRRD